MSLSGVVEIPRPFDRAQDMLQAKRRSVMPAPDQSRGQAPAGIEVIRRRGGSRPALVWIPAFAGKTDGAVDFQSTLSKSLGFEPRVV